tara:strand:+ start:4084 stop:4527 length:444 start_codon:yes stop_codon:yes gene_type:complete
MQIYKKKVIKMKTYTNGQRPMKMYGGGMASPRPPMMSATEKQRDRQRSKNVEPAMGMPRMAKGGTPPMSVTFSSEEQSLLNQLTDSQKRQVVSKINQKIKGMPFAFAAERNKRKLIKQTLKQMLGNQKNRKFLEQKRDAAASAGELK